jgi:hypothetical protein
MSVLPQLGKEVTIEALGKTWTVGRWSARVWDDLIAWLKPQLPDPYAHLERLIDKMSPEIANDALKRAEERANRFLSIGSPEVMELVKTPEVSMYLFWILLREKHPDVTRDQAMMIAASAGQDKMNAMFDTVAGTPPPSGNP